MKSFYILILAFFAAVDSIEAAECENGWTAFKDEICIRAFTTDFVSYDEAWYSCSSQGASASLLMVKGAELQAFLTNYTTGFYEPLWLGARFDNRTSEFKWEDGEPIAFSNWAEGYPRNDSLDGDNCIYVRPPNTKSPGDAKWEDAACQRRNLFICQRTLVWTLADAVNEIVKNRNELKLVREKLTETEQELKETNQDLAKTKTELVETKAELIKTKTELTQVNSRVIPVGSIYIEYFSQQSPTALWPSFSWEDISGTYAGLFFRTFGGGSEAWGTTQAACAPRITQKHLHYAPEEGQNPLTIPANGWSDFGYSGMHSYGENREYETQRYYTEGCEVRPTNQAIRIWRRTA